MSPTQRERELGYKPQKEWMPIPFLPISAAEQDIESAVLYKSIKENFARNVALSAFDPSLLCLTNKLNIYIRLYGLKFPKEDHIRFIKLFLNLIVIKHLEPIKLSYFLNVLYLLLKCEKLITPDELQIEWRPLYELTKFLLSKNDSTNHFYSFLPCIQTNLRLVITKCEGYFAETAMDEILNTILPTIYPCGKRESDGMVFLALFYRGQPSFLPKLIEIWNIYSSPIWSSELFVVLAHMSYDNVGFIDWEPYMPLMFTRIQRSIDFPVSYKGLKHSINPNLNSKAMTMWIVSALGPSSSAQKYLDQLMNVVTSYLHPSNCGKWVKTIIDLMAGLSQQMINRVVRERFRKHPWRRETEESFKLSDDCITAFVKSQKPAIFQAIYQSSSQMDVRRVLKNLADLRPELIVPDVLDEFFLHFDTVEEPRKLQATLQCVIAVLQNITGATGYSGSKVHLIPILMRLLPGIDSNDIGKMSIVFRFISAFAQFVPLIDSTRNLADYDAKLELTDDEVIIREQTSGFEDFILQYLDKIFQLIESNSQESIREEGRSDHYFQKSKFEIVAEAFIEQATFDIFSQCDDNLLTLAAMKVINYAKQNLCESKIAAPLVGGMVLVFSCLTPHEIEKHLIPFIFENLDHIFKQQKSPELIEKQTEEVLYNLILVSNIARTNSEYLLRWVDTFFVPILDKVLTFKCKTAGHYAMRTLDSILEVLSGIKLINDRNIPDIYGCKKTTRKNFPIRKWGESFDIHSQTNRLEFSRPTEACRLMCERLLQRYLFTAMKVMQQYVGDEMTLHRDQVLRHLNVINACLSCQKFLPDFDAESIKLINNIDMEEFILTTGSENLLIHYEDGSNLRTKIFELTAAVQQKLLEIEEDDTQSFRVILKIWMGLSRAKTTITLQSLLGRTNSSSHQTFFQEFKLRKFKKNTRLVVHQKVVTHMNIREDCIVPRFTKYHEEIMRNLVKLSISKYALIRGDAQQILFQYFELFKGSFLRILDDILLHLMDQSNPEVFKGSLYLLIGNKKFRILCDENMHTMERVWLSLLQTKYCYEKPSIVNLLDKAVVAISDEFPTFHIQLETNDDIIASALALLPPGTVQTAEIENGKLQLLASNEANRQQYCKLIALIYNEIKEKKLHWKYSLMASTMISNLVHPDINYPEICVKYFLHNLLNESKDERKLALGFLNFVLRQQHRKKDVVPMDPYDKFNLKREDNGYAPGFHDSILWMQYDETKLPNTKELWQQNVFVHKTEGFFGFSNEFKVLDYDNELRVDRTRDELNPVEIEIYDFFNDKSNLDKLIALWSLEVKKNSEKFMRSRLNVVKYLCGMFGIEIADKFVSYLEKLISEYYEASCHRCAAEIVCGLIKGSKHWPFAMVESLNAKLIPLIKFALTKMTPETDGFWGTCFATVAEKTDPRRQYWMYELLLENSFDPNQKTSALCSRIYCLQGPLNQQCWRLQKYADRVYDFISPHLDNEFQNIRERLSSLLTNLFEMDRPFIHKASFGPRINTITDLLVKKIQSHESAEIVELSYDDLDISTKRLYKTITLFLSLLLSRVMIGTRLEFLPIIPYACRFEKTHDDDPEAIEISKRFMSLTAQALTMPQDFDSVFEMIENIAFKKSSWSSRRSILDFLQVVVFYNMPLMLSEDKWVQQTKAIVLKLLEDEAFEVREKAAQVLSGLLHSSFLKENSALIKSFAKMCKTKYSNGKSNGNGNGEQTAALRKRHTGVLGLCAFVLAHPYDVPEFIPTIFEYLCGNINDPQPIMSTIYKTISEFKRTHYTNWEQHKLKFSEEQLSLLTDLSIPPSYCA